MGVRNRRTTSIINQGAPTSGRREAKGLMSITAKLNPAIPAAPTNYTRKPCILRMQSALNLYVGAIQIFMWGADLTDSGFKVRCSPPNCRRCNILLHQWVISRLTWLSCDILRPESFLGGS